jgi:hypothetical protein
VTYLGAALLLWLLCHPAFGWSQQKPIPEPEANQQQSQPDRRGTQDSPLVVKVLGPEGAKEQAAQNAEDRKLNRYLIGIGVVQAFIFFLQWRMMWRAKDTTERQLRAYVFVDKAEIHSLESVPGIRVIIKNFGQTPASGYSRSFSAEWVDTSNQLPPLSLYSSPDLQTESAVAPGGSITLAAGLSRAFTADEWTELRGGTKLMYISGEIRYTDAFGEERSTPFRYIFGGIYGYTKGPLAIAETGNDAT